MDQVKWDKNYLEMAKLVSGWSKDPNAQVGAVIVRNNRVVATGFNGFPTDVLDYTDRLEDKDKKLNMVVHAEENALIVAGTRAEGATLYVHGKPVCCRCAASIIQTGIVRVVAMHPNDEKDENGQIDKDDEWYKKGVIALEMFLETDIQFHGKTWDPDENPVTTAPTETDKKTKIEDVLKQPMKDFHHADKKEEVLAVVRGAAEGIGRAEILEAMGVKGDKRGEGSVSNALAALKKKGVIRVDDGKYSFC